MFRFFQINDPYRLVVALGLLVVVRSIFWIVGLPMSEPELKYLVVGERLGDGFMMYKEAYDYLSPLSATVYKWLDLIFGKSRFIHHFLSTILVFVNAAVFNGLLVRNKAYSENNYLSGFFYVLFSIAITDFFVLSPQLMSSTFVLMALNNVFRRIDNQVSDELFLYAGLYLGIATLFYAPSILFAIVFLGALLAFSNAIGRRIMLYLYGLSVPLLIIYGYYFLNDASDYFVYSVVGRGFFSQRIDFLDINMLFLVSAVPLFWFIVSFLRTIVSIRYGIYESKILRTLIYMALAAGLLIYIDVEFATHQLIFFIPTLSYLMTHYALSLRKKIFRFTMPSIIVLSLLVNPFYWIYTGKMDEYMIGNSDYEDEQKLMVLDDSNHLYRNTSIASPFIDPYLSRQNLDRLKYYDGSYEIYQAIDRKKPELIVDHWQVMDEIFKQFPILEKNYKRVSSNEYQLISSN